MRSPPQAVDPRVYQSVVLASLLVWGQTRLDFGLSPGWIASTLGAALLTQGCCQRIFQRPHRGGGICKRFDPWSALISGLSLCLLLRAPSVAVMIVAAVLAIASKFLLRAGVPPRDRHLFNPTNFAIVAMVALGLGWVSPAQWGSAAWFGLLVAGAGTFVVSRAARADVTVAFLGSWAALLFGRALWLGDPLAIPLRQLRSGALLIFAFYMISDPKTTPRTRAGRVVLAAAVAVFAFVVQFVFYRQDGLLYALAVCAPLATLAAQVRFRTPSSTPGDPRHESSSPSLFPLDRPSLLRRASAGAGLLRLLRRQGRQRPLQPQLARRPGA